MIHKQNISRLTKLSCVIAAAKLCSCTVPDLRLYWRKVGSWKSLYHFMQTGGSFLFFFFKTNPELPVKFNKVFSSRQDSSLSLGSFQCVPG